MTLINLMISLMAMLFIVICVATVGILLLMLVGYLDDNNPEWYKQLKKKLKR